MSFVYLQFWCAWQTAKPSTALVGARNIRTTCQIQRRIGSSHTGLGGMCFKYFFSDGFTSWRMQHFRSNANRLTLWILLRNRVWNPIEEGHSVWHANNISKWSQIFHLIFYSVFDLLTIRGIPLYDQARNSMMVMRSRIRRIQIPNRFEVTVSTLAQTMTRANARLKANHKNECTNVSSLPLPEAFHAIHKTYMPSWQPETKKLNQ